MLRENKKQIVSRNLHDAVSFARLSSFCQLYVPVGLPSLSRSMCHYGWKFFLHITLLSLFFSLLTLHSCLEFQDCFGNTSVFSFIVLKSIDAKILIISSSFLWIINISFILQFVLVEILFSSLSFFFFFFSSYLFKNL